MVDEGDAARGGMIGDALGRADAADASGVDLHIAEAGAIDHVLGQEILVAAFAAGELHRARSGAERVIGVEGAGDERLLEPGRGGGRQRRQARHRRLDIVDPHRAGVDQQDAVRPQTGARRLQLRGIVVHRAGAERPPSRI